VRVGAAAALLVGLLVAPAVGGCASSAANASATAPGTAQASAPVSASMEPVELLVLGAASLQGALEQAATAYEAATPGVTITVATDSSAALATRVEQGAPGDVFLSADTRNPERLVAGGFAEGAPVAFATNSLAVVVPAGNPAKLTSPADLARPGVLVIAAGEGVPITGYANQLVANLALQPGYPADFTSAYAANVASREANAKAVIAKLELGEGDAGIVYLTDAKASSGVTSLDIPAGANVTATYAGVALRESRHPEAAAAFLAWLAGPGGREILGPMGFGPAP
jgi:molybdate transport system substrate-binding protein